MDKPRRDHLREVIGKARREVEDSVQRNLANFGFFADSAPLAPEQVGLSVDRLAVHKRLSDAISRQARAVDGTAEVGPAAVARYVRECGATWINRLAALRALEVRGLLSPAAAFVSDEYGGLSPRAARWKELEQEQGREPKRHEALRVGLEQAFRELSESIRTLFDLEDDLSLVWPHGTCLESLQKMFSNEVTEADWHEPDVLGWVYQYYNTEANAALKRRKNKTTGFSYQPDDIPIANQFYTPEWVVRFLADNTLGRLWLEMHGRLPRLVSTTSAGGKTAYSLDERRQGVPHAARDAQGFAKWIAEEPAAVTRVGAGITFESVDCQARFLVPLPSEVPPRPVKKVRDLKVLDPACGSAHFLLVAFDLLFAMYREEEPDLDPREIPALILEHNLFGIDIDVRAAQLAALALYLKARETLARLDPHAPLKVRRLNIVVADAHLGDDPRKKAFLAKHQADPAIFALYQKILGHVDHTNVLGSLLKVRTEFQRALFGGDDVARTVSEAPGWEARGQQALSLGTPQRELKDVYRSVTGKRYTLDRLLEDLARFEAQALPDQDIGARLFYADLERTVGLLGLLSQTYDVVLMNPPYGDMPTAAKDYLKGNKKKGITAHYPRTHGDLAIAFLDQALDLLSSNGFMGALIPRSFMYLSSYEKVRTDILSREAVPEILQEYGMGILDGATVRTVGAVVRKDARPRTDVHPATFHRLSYYPTLLKPEKFVSSLPTFAATGPDPEQDWFVAHLGSLKDVPGMPYAYWASDSLRALFRKYPALDRDQTGALVPGRPRDKIADVKVGLATADDQRFLRYWWELPRGSEAIGWLPFVKGGRAIRFYSRVDLVVDWRNDGANIDRWLDEYRLTKPRGGVLGREYFLRKGLTWRTRTWQQRIFGFVPAGCVFSHAGQMLFLSEDNENRLISILCVTCSSMIASLKIGMNPERKWEAGLVSSLPMSSKALDSTTLPIKGRLLESYAKKRHVGDESCRDFEAPDLLAAYRELENESSSVSLDVAALLTAWEDSRLALATQEGQDLRSVDDEIFDDYELSPEDRALIERELACRPQSESGYSAQEIDDAVTDAVDSESQDAEADDDLDDLVDHSLTDDKKRDLVARWLSYYVRQTLEGDDDGIVPLDAAHGESALVLRVQETMERDLGRVAAHALLSQAAPILGKPFEQWLATDFFPWHVDLYRSRPIYWLLTSEGFGKGKAQHPFRAFVHYLKLTPDTLPRLVSYYLEPQRETVRSEVQNARLAAERAEGKARKVAEVLREQWVNDQNALELFHHALESVIEGPPQLQHVPANAKWLARTIAKVRGGQDVGHGYQPDIDYGVRVNLTPLAEKKLLPKAMLKKLGG